MTVTMSLIFARIRKRVTVSKRTFLSTWTLFLNRHPETRIDYIQVCSANYKIMAVLLPNKLK